METVLLHRGSMVVLVVVEPLEKKRISSESSACILELKMGNERKAECVFTRKSGEGCLVSS